MTEQQLRNKKVLENLLQMNQDEAYGWEDVIADVLEVGLNYMATEDAFGTERQCDPRGDCRDGEYSMWCVEGIDEPEYEDEGEDD